MKKLKQKDLEGLYGYFTGTGEALKNGESGYYFDSETKDVTIVTCSGNDGTYSRVLLTRDFLSNELGYIRNIYGETDDSYENARQKYNKNDPSGLIQDYFSNTKEIKK